MITKNITKLSEIASSDYLKLKFDTNILQNSKYSVTSHFIYPLLYDRNDILSVTVDDKDYFNFNAIQIDMNFEDDNNSLDFSYDYQQIEEKIQKSTKIEKLKTQGSFESSEIDNKRTAIVGRLLGQDDLDNKDELFNDLDNILISSAEKLSEGIEEHISENVQEVLDKYSDVLEDDSKKFLKSSSSIYNYYKNKDYKHFDYSMPGSGLWKLMELELNTSFVWYVRYKNNVCDEKSCQEPLLDKDVERNIKWVKLNEYDRENGLLNTLMLGQIKFLSGNKTVKTYFENEFILIELYNILQNIIILRNNHAHVKAMSLEKFEELHELFYKTANGLSNIEKLLNFKKLIKEKINE